MQQKWQQLVLKQLNKRIMRYMDRPLKSMQVHTVQTLAAEYFERSRGAQTKEGLNHQWLGVW